MQSAGLRLLTQRTIRQWHIDTTRSRCQVISTDAHRLFGTNKEQPKGHNDNHVESIYKPCQKVRVAATMPIKAKLEPKKEEEQQEPQQQTESAIENTTWTGDDVNKAMDLPCSSAPKLKLPHRDAAATAWSEECRQINANNKTLITTSMAKSKLVPNQMRQDVEGYMFTRLFDHVKNYDKLLEKNFPSAMQIYRVFFDGVKHFFGDMKNYLKISRIVHNSPHGLKALNRKELELYMRMPRDMIKIAPTLVFTSLPMIGYAVFPIVFMYPRKFLTTHFWTEQQRGEFQQMQLKERLCCNREVLRMLQANLRLVENHEKYEQFQHILGLLGSGFHPSVNSILDIKDIFAASPYRLQSLSSKHLKSLTQLQGISGGMFQRHRLTEHAFLVHHMDLAIKREGDVHNMMPTALRYSCLLRGLNPDNLKNEEMIDWLRNWITVSTAIQSEHISLFLHLPLLLAYNYPSNWKLIYDTQLQHKKST